MDILDRTIAEAHEWARMRIATLTHSNNKELNPSDEKCIREEFREWLDSTDEDHEVYSLEYIGEDSEFS